MPSNSGVYFKYFSVPFDTVERITLKQLFDDDFQ